MKRNSFFGIVLIVLMASCASRKNEATSVISPYGVLRPAPGQSVLVYGLPQTRLYFEVELAKTLIKKGPYAEYASRMLGLQNVPLRDSESWQIKSIRVSDRQEIDNKHLYSLLFTEYPENIDKMLRFTKEGLLLDVTISNVLMVSQNQGKTANDFQFVNSAVRSATIEKVDTVFTTLLNDTAFVRIPVLLRKVMSKTIEEQAREAADQIFDIRKWRNDILIGDVEFPYDGAAFIMALQTLDRQEEQLLSLFNGAKIESRQIVTYQSLPEKPETNVELFYFSDRAGIVSRNTPGSKAVWYETGKVVTPVLLTPEQQAKNIIYYRIPQAVEVSAGVDQNTLVREIITICQFGNIVSFPLIAPKNK